MTGARITVTVDDASVREAFAQLQRLMGNTGPIMSAIGSGLVSNTHTRFQAGRSPDGSAWAPLHPAYAAGKKGPGILRESGMRGGLMGSITHAASASEVRIGSNKAYAAIHQFGGTIKPRSASHLVFRLGGELARAQSVTIPARPYLGIGPEDEATIAEVILGALDRAAGTGGTAAP